MSDMAILTNTAGPILTMTSPGVRFLTGDRITLECDAGRELRSKKYIWNFDNQGDRVGNKTYIIAAAEKKDNGTYKCKTKSSTGAQNSPYSNTILVNITDPDKEMKIEAEPKLLWPGQSLLLTCKFSYLLQGELIYSFYREGSRLTEIRSSNKSVSFKMEHVTLEDNGRYRCEVRFANYPSGRVYSSAYTPVMVKESPVRLSVEPKTQKDGDTITLRCLCTDFLLHCGEQYVVYRNNSFLASISMIPGIHRIQNATVMDSGWYHCVASSNDEEYTSRVVEIIVKKIPVANTQLHIIPSGGKIRERSNLTLTCSVTEGSTPIQYTWYRGGTEFHNETSSSKEVAYKIYHFNESNEGQYSCSAINNAEGMDFAICSRAVQLMVEVPVSCPSLISDWNSSVVAIGDRVTLVCKSQRGTPPIHYLFFRDHRYLLANTTVIDSGTGNFTFTVQSEWEGGVYSCGAANGIADVANCSRTMTLSLASAKGIADRVTDSLMLICVPIVASVLILVLPILIIVCKIRHKKKENTDNCNRTGNGSGRSSPHHNSATPGENSAPAHDEIVYAVVQPKRKRDGHDSNETSRSPRKPHSSGYYVTYATLNHLQMEQNRESLPREEEKCSQSAGIYQNIRRA
ncbi:Fc receptor-like protein 5 isoform X2 [Heterodontus francisci]|uniref:Fc receptor-like protein 5 isoform X2 n=1 Tax=Heterodontus francisci TaxID=7792 RepID=UPI00355C7F7B